MLLPRVMNREVIANGYGCPVSQPWPLCIETFLRPMLSMQLYTVMVIEGYGLEKQTWAMFESANCLAKYGQEMCFPLENTDRKDINTHIHTTLLQPHFCYLIPLMYLMMHLDQISVITLYTHTPNQLHTHAYRAQRLLSGQLSGVNVN